MRKMSTLFKKDPKDLGRVINEVNPENEWVFTSGIPTRKFDGTSCFIDKEGSLYRRYDAKKGKVPPKGAIPCCEADIVTGHHPHWVLCDRNNSADKFHFEAYDQLAFPAYGTYELCGPKIQSNRENFENHILVYHGIEILDIKDYSFESIKEYLEIKDIEGIVFYDENDFARKCKIRKKDFGIERK